MRTKCVFAAAVVVVLSTYGPRATGVVHAESLSPAQARATANAVNDLAQGIQSGRITLTPTQTVTPSVTPIPTGTPTLTPLPTQEPTATATATPTPCYVTDEDGWLVLDVDDAPIPCPNDIDEPEPDTPEPTATPTPTQAPTPTPIVIIQQQVYYVTSPGEPVVERVVETVVVEVTSTPPPVATITPFPTLIDSPTPWPTLTPTPQPSSTPTSSPIPTRTAAPTQAAVPEPGAQSPETSGPGFPWGDMFYAMLFGSLPSLDHPAIPTTAGLTSATGPRQSDAAVRYLRGRPRRRRWVKPSATRFSKWWSMELVDPNMPPRSPRILVQLSNTKLWNSYLYEEVLKKLGYSDDKADDQYSCPICNKEGDSAWQVEHFRSSQHLQMVVSHYKEIHDRAKEARRAAKEDWL